MVSERVTHDFKRIARTLKLLADEMDMLYKDITKEVEDGIVDETVADNTGEPR